MYRHVVDLASDLYVGVTAVLIARSGAQPSWSPASLRDVSCRRLVGWRGGVDVHRRRERGPWVLCTFSSPLLVLLLLLLQVREETVLAFFEPLPAALELELPGADADGHERARL